MNTLLPHPRRLVGRHPWWWWFPWWKSQRFSRFRLLLLISIVLWPSPEIKISSCKSWRKCLFQLGVLQARLWNPQDSWAHLDLDRWWRDRFHRQEQVRNLIPPKKVFCIIWLILLTWRSPCEALSCAKTTSTTGINLGHHRFRWGLLYRLLWRLHKDAMVNGYPIQLVSVAPPIHAFFEPAKVNFAKISRRRKEDY